jgi:hypothetical protein
MNNLSTLILTWGPFIVQIVLLSFQIYTYRRTNHYSLALLAAGTTTGILAFGLSKILNAEVLAASVRVAMYDAIVILYCVYMVSGLWGAVSLFQSYRRLTEANKFLTSGI